MILSKPKKKGEKDPYASEYTEQVNPEADAMMSEMFGAPQAIQMNRPRLEMSDKNSLATLNQELQSNPMPTVDSLHQRNLDLSNLIPSGEMKNMRSPEAPLEMETLQDPLSRAKAELGERKGPGFWGRLGQGLRALATGDGIGGFVLGLGDTYGQADHRARLQELASQYDEENKMKQQSFANTLNARKQSEAERMNDARISDYESRITDREARITQAGKELENEKAKSKALLEFKDKELLTKDQKYKQDSALRRAKSLIDIMRYTGTENPQVAAELSQILETELPPELALPLQNQWQMTKAGLLNKTTGEVRPNQDPMGNRFTINISGGGRGGGGDERNQFRPVWRNEPITDISELAVASTVGGSKTRPVLYYTNGNQVIKAGTNPSTGEYLSAEESMKPLRPPFIRR